MKTLSFHTPCPGRFLFVLLIGLMMYLPSPCACAAEVGSIASGDMLFIKVFRHPELSTTTQVDDNGNITLPYVGNITVTGISDSEAQSRVSSALTAILKSPRVTVSRKAGMVSSPAGEEPARTVPMTTQVIQVENSSADVLQKAMAGMSSPGGSISADPDSNTLIITDTPDVVLNMAAAIHEVDQLQTQVTQVHIESKILEVSSEGAKEIGVRWSAVGDKLTGGYTPGVRQDSRLGNIRGINDPIYNEKLGTSQGNNAPVRQFVDQNKFDRRLQVPLQIAAPGQMYLGFMNKGIDLVTLIDALVANNKAELLASPYIRTVNHKMANIKMLQEYPFTEFGTAGLNSIQSTRFLNIGITLDVTPHVRKDPSGEAYVQLELKPEVSTATGMANGVPIRSVRSSESIANVRNGQTLVIGGIVQKDAHDVVQKVPGLGSVPVLGALFRHKEKSKANSELMIFVTPTVYEHPEDVPTGKNLNLTQISDSPLPDAAVAGEKRKD